MVYDPALTRVYLREPRLDRLVAALRQTTSGRRLLAEAAELGFRFTGQSGRQPVILPFGTDVSFWRDLEAFVWQVERQLLTIMPRSDAFMGQLTELSTRTFARTRTLFDDINEIEAQTEIPKDNPQA